MDAVVGGLSVLDVVKRVFEADGRPTLLLNEYQQVLFANEITLRSMSGSKEISIEKQRIQFKFDEQNRLFSDFFSKQDEVSVVIRMMESAKYATFSKRAIRLPNYGTILLTNFRITTQFEMTYLAKFRYSFRLTQKEEQIICNIMSGCSVEKTAVNLGNSLETIRTHIRNIYKKTGCRTREELMSLLYGFRLPI